MEESYSTRLLASRMMLQATQILYIK